VAPDYGIHWRLAARPGLAYRAIDLYPGRYGYAGAIEAGDLTALEEEDGSVDLLIANHVLEHIPDEARALAEIRRVLRPGGTALLQVPIALKLDHTLEDPTADTPEARERVYGQADHVRLYGRDHPAHLERNGFRVELYAAPPEVCQRWRLNPRELLPVLSPR
jgi:SAM-dependent methyltransferase